MNTIGVYQRVMRRSIFSVGDLLLCASSIIFMMRVIEESENSRTLSKVTARSTGIMPDTTSSPGL